MRNHRSRVNFINRATPVGVDGRIVIETKQIPQVYTSFHTEKATVEQTGNICIVTLPKECSYAILQFKK
jgi:hypothetical protein